MGIQRIDTIKTKRVLRLTTLIPELDWLYGFTSKAYGLPAGKMSLWAGEKGTGKSRAAIEVCRKVAHHVYQAGTSNPFKSRVLYFQKEVDMGTLVSWYTQDGSTVPINFVPSDSSTVDEQCADILEVRPHLVIVDSINMIKEFRGHSEDAIEVAIEKYRKVCEATSCHIIFLQQLNKDGSPKGSSSIAHLLDVELILRKNGPDGFSMACPQKNRYGQTGISIWWVHTTQKAYCESKFRFEDKTWATITGNKYRDIEAEGKVWQAQLQREEELEELKEQEEEEIAYEEFLESQRTPLQSFWHKWVD
ncbi:MAG: AAA family ATPase [Clostridiales bacterium]|nr:AAA family ATPase [Clostridiales bacterium]